jgi:DNA-binding transcriptional MerR regulator
MFGIDISKIVIALIGAALIGGYYYYTQGQLAELNQAVAQKEFALKVADETIKKQAEDMKKQQEVLKQTYEDMQAARGKVSELEGKFAKLNLDQQADKSPIDLEKRVNKATDKVFRCFESVVNKGAANAPGC